MEAPDLTDDLEEVLYTRDEIQDRIKELAAEIDRDYADKEVLIVGVLKGAVMVMADLSRRAELPRHPWIGWRSPPTAPAPSPPVWCGF